MNRFRGALLPAFLLLFGCSHSRPVSDDVEDLEAIREGEEVLDEGSEPGDGETSRLPSEGSPLLGDMEEMPSPPRIDDELPGSTRRPSPARRAGAATGAAPKTARYRPTTRRPDTFVASLTWPLGSTRVTSRFGLRVDPLKSATAALHRGVDIGSPFGSPVWAAADGEVAYAGAARGRGNTVEIYHSESLSTVYAHMDRVMVKVGATVRTGDLIGIIGNSGRSTGPHLHFEVWHNRQPVDPIPFFRKDRSPALAAD